MKKKWAKLLHFERKYINFALKICETVYTIGAQLINKYKYFSTHSTHKNSIYNKTDSIFEGNVIYDSFRRHLRVFPTSSTTLFDDTLLP